MISCVEWIPKGAADPTPKRYEMGAAELAMLQEQAELEVRLNEGKEEEDSDDESEDENDLPKIDPSSLPADLRMDEYSSDEEDGARVGNLLIGKQGSEIIGTRTGEDGLPVEEFEDDDENENEADPPSIKDEEEIDDSDDSYSGDDDLMSGMEDLREYEPIDVEGLEAMGLSHSAKGGAMYLNEEDENDDDSDKEDTNLAPDDALIVVAKTEEDFATLAIHVYEQNSGNLFVHHDIPLPSFPLCLAHGDINNDGGAGNYCAVGTFSPGIEVWNLDILDALEPTCILGGEDTSGADELMKINMARAATGKKMKKKKNKKTQQLLKPGSHTDAIMALHWNKVHRQIIASGSADNTVKLWDITQNNENSKPAATFSHHTNKVNCVAWHPTEGTLLATGSFDQTVALVDARSNDGECKKAKLPGDCEAVRWDPFNEHLLTAASEDGSILCWDVRKFEEPCWAFVAHEFGVSDFSYNSHVPGMMATVSVDKTVALWDVQNIAASNQKPYQCGSKEMNVGKLFTAAFYPSTPWLLGCGGSGNELALWDLSSEEPLQKRFGDRVNSVAGVGGTATITDVMKSDNNTDGDNNKKEEDFEAMMLAGDAAVQTTRQEATSKRNKNKKKGKKKAHKRN